MPSPPCDLSNGCGPPYDETRCEAMRRECPFLCFHRRPQPHASGLVRVFSSRDPVHVQQPRQLYPQTATLQSCASRRSVPAAVVLSRTTAAGQMSFSRIAGCSPSKQLTKARATPDEETNDGRAVCGRTARTVRREGRRKPFLPLSAVATRRSGDVSREVDESSA